METSYEKCRLCWHFIERNDTDPEDFAGTGIVVAEYVHLDNGEIEHDHDAEPSGDRQTLAAWKQQHPELFRSYPDGQTGPNSVYFGK